MLDELASSVAAGNLIAFLGAGVSRAWSDPITRRNWPGIPGAAEIVAELGRTRAWARVDDLTFDAAMFLLRTRENRTDLERFITGLIDKPAIRPLPAHTLLASMGIRTFITSNYDTLMERALEDANHLPRKIVVDEDVARLQPHEIPVIKYHGCVTRPETIIAARDEYLPIDQLRPIISALLVSNLANKSLLFAGFALNDPDFNTAYDTVSRILGQQYMPRSYAITRTVTDFQRSYWQSKGLKVIEGDLTTILRDLNALRQTQDRGSTLVIGDWGTNPFFESLQSIGTRPSETQVADAFLAHLMQLLEQGVLPVEDIVRNAVEAQDLVMGVRPNFHAFREVSNSAISGVSGESHPGGDPVRVMRTFQHNREAISLEITNLGKEVGKGATLGLYSQSKRVQQMLLGVPRATQETCGLIIAECRPKSPGAFQDALEVAKALTNTSFQMTLVPDVALAHMLSRNQISQLLIGAHAVYLRDGTPKSFVNTAGSAALCQVAQSAGVPIWVVAEKVKLASLDSDDDPTVSYSEEEQLFGDLEVKFAQLRSEGVSISAKNIGYDYVSCGPGMRVLTEGQKWTL